MENSKISRKSNKSDAKMPLFNYVSKQKESCVVKKSKV